MTTFNHPIPYSRKAGAVILLYRFVKEGPGGTVVQCDTLGEPADGVAVPSFVGQTEVGAGEAVAVVPMGPWDIPMRAGAAIADEAEVITDATGRPITAVVGEHAILGKVVNGSSAGGAGDKLTIRGYPIGQSLTADS